MTLAEKAYALQQKINRCIDTYGECPIHEAEELERLCDLMDQEDQYEFLALYEEDQK